jgi:SulP family sulfate permease
MRFVRPSVGDAVGGLAATTVVLPQAMAFGMALWTVAGGDAARGALAGLLGAVALSLVSGVVGGTTGLVSAPAGPTFVLLSGAVASFAAAGLRGEALLTSLAVLVACAGLAQVLLGQLRGGQLIKFVPYPVVAGFMTGSALLMILSQWRPAVGAGVDAPWGAWRLVPLATAGVTIAAIALVPRMAPAVPGAVAGLVLGTLAFHALTALAARPVPAAWLVAGMPPLSAVRLGAPAAALAAVPWRLVVPAALAFAVLASLNTLLVAAVADGATGDRHDARRELLGQGLGHLACGLLGGMGGNGTTGSTLLAIRTGGRRWVAACTALTVAALVVAAGSATAYLPRSVLAGVILHVAVVGVLEWDIVKWALAVRTRADALTALLVTGITVWRDLTWAVGLGVALAILQFVRAQVRAPVVHRRSTAAQRPSLRRRPESARRRLAQHGDRIVLYELQGNLFFGTADRLFDEIHADLERRAWVVLDMGRVTQVDLTALRRLRQMESLLHGHGGELLLANLRGDAAAGAEVRASSSGPSGGARATRMFVDADEAVEAAEDALLSELGQPPQPRDATVRLEAHELCHGLDAASLESLRKALRRRSVPAGTSLFGAGDPGDELFLVVRGEVDARLPYGDGAYKRIAKFGPGTFFGEVSFLEPGARSADATATHDAELLVLDRAGFAHLEAERPPAAIALLVSLGRELSTHLRSADVELRRLASW